MMDIENKISTIWFMFLFLQGSIPCGDWEFFSSLPCPERLWGLPTAYPMDTRVSLSGGKATEVNDAWSYTSTPPIRLRGVVLS